MKLKLLLPILALILSLPLKGMQKNEPIIKNDIHQAMNYVIESNLGEKIEKLRLALLDAMLSENLESIEAVLVSCPEQARAYLSNTSINLLHIKYLKPHYPRIMTFLKELDEKKMYGLETNTPLDISVYLGNEKMIKLLLSYKATIENSSLRIATLYQPSLIQLLIDNGADKNGESLLHMAAQKGNIDAAKALIQAGADVYRKERQLNLTPLMIAGNNGHYKFVEYLLKEAKTYVDSQDPDGSTALQWATMNMHSHIADLLLRYGADITHKDNNGKTVIEYISYDFGSLLALHLLKNGAPYPNSDMHKKMLEEQYEHNIQYSTDFIKEYFPLFIMGNTDAAIASLLKAPGNALNDTTVLMDQLTPLHWAVIRGDKEVFRALLERRIDNSIVVQQPVNINCRDDKGRTPLMWAARLGYGPMYNALVKAGANRMIRDHDNKLALTYAAETGNITILKDMILENPNVFQILNIEKTTKGDKIKLM